MFENLSKIIDITKKMSESDQGLMKGLETLAGESLPSDSLQHYNPPPMITQKDRGSPVTGFSYESMPPVNRPLSFPSLSFPSGNPLLTIPAYGNKHPLNFNYQDYNIVKYEPSLFQLEWRQPKSKSELYTWLEAIRKIYFGKLLILFLKYLFQDGRIDYDNQLFISRNIIVLLESQNISSIQEVLPFGGWYDRSTNIYGYDIIGLCIYIQKISFDTVMAMICAFAKDKAFTSESHKEQNNKIPWYEQEKIPITEEDIPVFKIFFAGCKNTHTSVYYTSYGKWLKFVDFISIDGEEEIPVYYTICKHHRSHKLFGQPIAPSKPYCLYNLHLIICYPDAPIVFVKNEKEADLLQNKYSPYERILTTCFLGHINLLYADLSPLSDRKIIINIEKKGSLEFRSILSIIKRLEDNNVKEVFFTFDLGMTTFSSLELKNNPEAWGFSSEKKSQSESISPKLLSFEEIPDGIDEEIELVVSPCIEARTINIISGAAKSYKTYLGYCLAYAIITGYTKVGYFETEKSHNVLYIDKEMDDPRIKLRMKSISAGQNGDGTFAGLLFYSVKDKSGKNRHADLLSEEWQNLIENLIKEQKIDVIFIDNLHAFLRRKAHLSPEAFDWFSKLNGMGVTVIVIDHQNDEKELYGSKSKERDADLVISLDSDSEGLINVSYPFIRNFAKEDLKEHKLKPISETDPESGKRSFMFKLVEKNDSEVIDNNPDNIKKIAFIVYLRENIEKKLVFNEIESIYGIDSNTAQNRGVNQKKKLDNNQQTLLKNSLAMLIQKFEGKLPSKENVAEYI